MINIHSKGYFKITDCLIKSDWADISVIFKDFRPTNIEFRHWENDIWYFWGVSDLFDEVKEAEIIPQYDVIFTKDEKDVSYKFEKVNK